MSYRDLLVRFRWVACIACLFNVIITTHVHAQTAPNGPTCDKLDRVKWGEITLYNLTYGCIPRGWTGFFRQREVRSLIRTISGRIERDIQAGADIEPEISNVFRAFYEVRPSELKAVILGQDPAPQRGIANGLSFSTKPNVHSNVTASIQRVLLAAQNQGYCVNLNNGYLGPWVDEGVLLLNMALTIRCDEGARSCKIASHLDYWKEFTRELFRLLDKNVNPKAFIFWGGKARAYGRYVRSPQNVIIEGGHPSPYDTHGERYFCKRYFLKANEWLQSQEQSPVNWSLADNCSRLPQACYWTWNRRDRSSTCYSTCE